MFSLRFAWRDGRSARRLLLFVSAMALGVAALVAIQSFSDQLSASVEAQARELAGADLNVYARRAFTTEDEALVDSLAQATGAETVRQLVFTSMAFFPRDGGSRLVQVRASDGAFPFYGSLETTPEDAFLGYLAAGEALVDASLLLQFDAAPGDSVRIGETTYRIAGRVEAAAGQPDVAAFVAPRVYLPLDALDETLTGFGSRVETNAYFRLPETANPEAILASIEPAIERRRLRAWTADGLQSDWNDTLGALGGFLTLAGFIALLLGGLGVASAVTVYVRRKTETVATLRCLGAPARVPLTAFVAQTAVLGLIASVLGAALGVMVQAVLPAVLAPFLPVAVPFGIAWGAVGTGIGVGLAVSLGFALGPLVSVRRIPPLAALRPELARVQRRDPLRWLLALLLGLGVGGFAYLQTGNTVAAVAFPLALVVALVVLALVSQAVIALTRRLTPAGLPYVARQGLANLYRPGNQTLVLLVTLGLGVGLLLTLYVAQATLLGQVRFPGGSEAERPGLFLFDIQREQVEGVVETIEREGAPVIDRVPVVSMRIRTINGQDAETIEAARAWALRREYRSTYRDALTPTETLVEGSFTGRVAPDAEVVPVSLSEDIAADLGVRLGDRITWDVGGIPIESELTSLRRVDWARVSPNFFAVFPDGPINEAPQFFIVTTRTGSPEADATLQRALVREHPNVSVVDVQQVATLIEAVASRVAFVLQFIALFALATGLVVLAGAVRVSRVQRVEEGVLLRTLGAERKQVRRILTTEYAVLGALAAFVGAGLALGGGWALARFAFDVPLVPAWGALALALISLPLLTLMVGLAGSRGLLARPPLDVLRQEG